MAARVPLVLLHPFPFDARFWHGLREHLLHDGEVITPEAPGFGASAASPGWQIADWAVDIARQIAALPAGRAVVCGLSMGGYAALSLIEQHPELVAGLVLADTRAEADSPEARQGREDSIARIGSQGIAPWIADALPGLVAGGCNMLIRGELAQQAVKQSPQAVCDALRALRDRPDRVDLLPSIACPTLVMVGESDGITPTATAQSMSLKIPSARLHTVPLAGHLSAAEQPASFAEALVAFWDRVA